MTNQPGIEERITTSHDTSAAGNSSDSATTHDIAVDTINVAKPRSLSTRNSHLKRPADSIGSVLDTTKVPQSKRVRVPTLPYIPPEAPTSSQDVQAVDDTAAALLQQYIRPTQNTSILNSQASVQSTTMLPESTITTPESSLGTTLTNRLTTLLTMSSTLHNQLAAHKSQVVTIGHDLDQTLVPRSVVLETNIAALKQQIDGEKAKHVEIEQQIQKKRQELKHEQDTMTRVERRHTRSLEKIAEIQRLLEVVDDEEEDDDME